MNQETVNYLSIMLPLVLMLIGLFLAVFADSYIGRRHKIASVL